MVLDKLTENAQKNENQNRNFEIEIPKQTMDSVAMVVVLERVFGGPCLLASIIPATEIDD